jgi:hypothetical protein
MDFHDVPDEHDVEDEEAAKKRIQEVFKGISHEISLILFTSPSKTDPSMRRPGKSSALCAK